MPKTNISVKDKNSLVLWDFVQARYKDFSGDAMPRDHADAAKKNTYKDNSNRNDITDIRVTHDDKNAYFYVRTADDITEYDGTDKNWMNILISVKGGGFAGFDFIVNRSVTGNVTSVEKSNGGYSWEKVGEGDIAVYGNVMVVSVHLFERSGFGGHCRNRKRRKRRHLQAWFARATRKPHIKGNKRSFGLEHAARRGHCTRP